MRRTLTVLAIVAVACGTQAETAGGLQWKAPSNWKSLGSRPMRAATYVVPAVAGDKEDGECAVYYFGPGQGGSVEANIDRWVGQFEQPDGRPSKRAAQIRKQKINGLAVTTIDLSGTYTGSGGPMARAKVSKPGYRLLGAIIEGPQGPLFFKFTGPTKTVAAGEADFQAMLNGLSQ